MPFSEFSFLDPKLGLSGEVIRGLDTRGLLARRCRMGDDDDTDADADAGGAPQIVPDGSEGRRGRSFEANEFRRD